MLSILLSWKDIQQDLKHNIVEDLGVITAKTKTIKTTKVTKNEQ